MKKFFSVRQYALEVDVAFLLMRVFVGYAFIMHGWGKIQSPFSWMGPEAPVPGFFQLLAALSEFGGGIGLIIGLVTRLGSLGLTITMAVASSMHLFAMGDPAVSMKGERSAELALAYLFVSLLVTAAGPGRFSLDRKVFGAKP